MGGGRSKVRGLSQGPLVVDQITKEHTNEQKERLVYKALFFYLLRAEDGKRGAVAERSFLI
jgi:hypothetical protein